MNNNSVREKFNQSIESLVAKKRGDNKAFLSRDEYRRRLKEVKNSKTVMSTPGSKKHPRDYKNVHKYDVVVFDGAERLVKKSARDDKELVNVVAANDDGNDDDDDDDAAAVPVRFFVTNDDLFDILDACHVAVGHGGRDKMVSRLKRTYCNITKEAVMTYLNLCAHCKKKSSGQKRTKTMTPAVPRPMSRRKALGSRAQMDLIDMRSQSYGGYRYVLNHQDHLTKFVMLRPLRAKDAAEIAVNLMDIYTTFGAPAILHYKDDDIQFVIQIFGELDRMWGDIKVIHGKPEHSQSQSSIERANRDVEDMLVTWMAENNSKDWPAALKLIQFRKNRAFYSDIGKSPYEAMFGCPVKLGVGSNDLPTDEITNLNTEENMEFFIDDDQFELFLDKDTDDERNLKYWLEKLQ